MFRPQALALVVLAAALPSLADEGMWTYDNFPADKVKAKYETASTATREKVADLKQRVEGIEVEDVVEQTRDYVRSNPGKALLISIGVGFIIGLLVRGTGDDD